MMMIWGHPEPCQGSPLDILFDPFSTGFDITGMRVTCLLEVLDNSGCSR